MSVTRLAGGGAKRGLVLFDEVVAHGAGAPGEGFQNAVLIGPLVVVLTEIHELGALGQHAIEDRGQFVGGGGDGLGHAPLRGLAPQKGPQRALGVVQTLGRDPQRRGGSVRRGRGAPTEHLAATHPVVRRQPQPGAECLAVGHFVMSRPVSLSTFSTVCACSPLIAIRFTPVSRNSSAVASKLRSCRSARGAGPFGGVWPSLRSAKVSRWA